MSDYLELVAAYESRLLRSHSIRQVDDTTAHWSDYDNEIATLARELHRFKSNIPRLRELDELLREASDELASLEAVTETRTRHWTRTAAWSGALGGAGLLGALALDLPGIVIVVSLLLLAVCAASVAVKVRTGRNGTADVTDARAYLDALKVEQAELLPRHVDDLVEDGWVSARPFAA